MNFVRRAHFVQSRKLIERFKGQEIKTIGDCFMSAFRCVDDALDYALALQAETGHPQVKIRAGIHFGSIQVEEGDVFGGAVNFAARVVGAIKGAEIWLSGPAKQDIDHLAPRGTKSSDGNVMASLPYGRCRSRHVNTSSSGQLLERFALTLMRQFLGQIELFPPR